MQENGNIFVSLLPLVVLFGIFYFLVIRPQQKQQKNHKKMLEDLQKGDKIITNGGLIAEIVKPEKNFLKIRLSDNVIVNLSRDYVAKKADTEDKES